MAEECRTETNGAYTAVGRVYAGVISGLDRDPGAGQQLEVLKGLELILKKGKWIQDSKLIKIQKTHHFINLRKMILKKKKTEENNLPNQNNKKLTLKHMKIYLNEQSKS